MTEQEMQAIAGGYHGDAFAVLGPHQVSKDGKSGWEVNAFLPHAQDVVLATGERSLPMKKVHGAGIFSIFLDSQRANYKFRITDHAGHVGEAEDVYRFPPLLTEFDLHLHAEGTNYEE